MKIIRVTCGGCGIRYTDANGIARHALKTHEDGPFECDDAQADRLVSMGVAMYVTTEKTEEPAGEKDDQNEGQADDDQEPEKVTGTIDRAELEAMTIEQLKNLAGDIGVSVNGCKRKPDYIEAIMAEEVEVDTDEDDNELPDLNAADPE